MITAMLTSSSRSPNLNVGVSSLFLRSWRLVLAVSMLLHCYAIGTAEASWSTLTLVKLNDAADKGAVCNDNSAPGYYFSPGTTSVMLVFFQGGFHCWDDASCVARFKAAPGLMSSNTWASQQARGGVFDDDETKNPFFAGATKVYVPYCTSDSYSGDSEKPALSGNWVFRGRRVLDAVFDHLVSSGKFDNIHTLVIGGCSAGGRGAVYNLDRLCSKYAVGSIRCVGMHDAGWWLNEIPMSSGQPVSLYQTLEAGVPLWNASVLDGKCPNSAPGHVSPSCYFGATLINYVKTPLFMHAEQYDAFQLGYDIGVSPPYKNASQAAFAASFRSSLSKQLVQDVKPPNRAFSCACFDHCLSESDTFFDVRDTKTNTSFHQALHEWLILDVTAPVIDTCEGVNCSPGCPPLPLSA